MSRESITGDINVTEKVRSIFLNGVIELSPQSCPECGEEMVESRTVWNGLHVTVNECQCGHRELADDTIHDPRVKPK